MEFKCSAVQLTIKEERTLSPAELFPKVAFFSFFFFFLKGWGVRGGGKPNFPLLCLFLLDFQEHRVSPPGCLSHHPNQVLPVPVKLLGVGAKRTPLLTVPQCPDSTQPPAATLSPHPFPSAGTSTSILSSRKGIRPLLSLLGASVQPQKGNRAVCVLCHLLFASLRSRGLHSSTEGFLSLESILKEKKTK